MKKRMTAFLLALLMLVPAVLTACAESENTDETAGQSAVSGETTDASAETEMTRANTPDDLPDNLDFGGATATIAARTKAWFTGEMYVEELNGEVVNDAVYDRDLDVEDRLKVTINYELLDDTNTPVNTNVTAGTDFYTLHVGSAVDTVQHGVNGNYYNLLGAYPEYLNLNQPWWSQYYTEQSSVSGVTFFATGDMCFSLTKLAFVTFANMQMVQDFGLENPYDLVREGTWTFDREMEMASHAYVDKNGDTQADSADTFGMSMAGEIGLDPYWSAFNLSIIERESDGTPIFSVNQEKMVSVLEKLASYYKKVDYVYVVPNSGDAEQDEVAKMLSEDRMLFSPLRIMHTEQIRDMESSYALLPLPKWDEEQDTYYTFVHDQYSIVGIPLSVQDPAMASAVMEAMAAESYRHVMPAYYDLVLNGKYIREPDTAAMLDIAMAGIKIDFGWIYTYSLGSISQNLLRSMIYGEKSERFTSSFRATEKVTKKLMEKLAKSVVTAAEDQEG